MKPLSLSLSLAPVSEGRRGTYLIIAALAVVLSMF